MIQKTTRDIVNERSKLGSAISRKKYPHKKSNSRNTLDKVSFEELEDRLREFEAVTWIARKEIISKIMEHQSCKEYHNIDFKACTCLDVVLFELGYDKDFTLGKNDK